jgi:hypothetical protein
MSNVADIVDAIISKQGADATDMIHSELSQRALSSIDNMKTDIAMSIFEPQQMEDVAAVESVPDAIEDSTEGTTNENV